MTTSSAKEVRTGIFVAALFIATALGLSALRAGGVIGGEFVPRAFGILCGMVLSGYANIIPRRLVAWQPGSDRAARGQACLRFCAWVFVLAGLANAAIWAFAPLRQAALWSMVPIIAAFLLVGARILQAKRKAI